MASNPTCQRIGGRSFWGPDVGEPLNSSPSPEVAAVKEANLAFVGDHRIKRLESNALQAIAPSNRTDRHNPR
jgi:hypothetical protein